MNRSSTSTVLFLCPSLAGAGVERRVCTLLNHIERDRYHVSLGLLRQEGPLLQEVGNTRVHYVEPPLVWLNRLLCPVPYLPTIFNFFAAVYQQRRMLARVQPDVVVTFTMETMVPLSLIGATLKEKNIRWVISEDSNTTTATLYWCKNRWLAAPVIAVLRRAYRKADAIAAVSTNVRTSLRTMYRVPERMIAVIANPVDDGRIRRTEADTPPPGADAPFVMTAGRLVKVKRLDLLLTAFAEARKRQAIKLVILGEGPEKQALQRLAEQLGVADDVMLPGFVADPWAYMRHAGAFVLTSKTEGFGNVLVEAMASGCPVISTDSGGPRDIIIHNRNGIIAEDNPQAIAAAILGVLNDQPKREEMIRAAASGLDKYRVEHICGQLCCLFDEVLDGRRKTEDGRRKMVGSQESIL